jgi:hypothetical protein
MTYSRNEILETLSRNPKSFFENLLPRNRGEKRPDWLRCIARAVGVTPRRMKTIFYSPSAKCLGAYEWEAILRLHGVLQQKNDELQRQQAAIRGRLSSLLGNTHDEDNPKHGSRRAHRAGHTAVVRGDTLHGAG